MSNEAACVDEAGNAVPVGELVALDLLTLRAHTERAGDRLDPEAYRLRLIESLPVSRLCLVRRAGCVVAYGMFTQTAPASWLITAFSVHPGHRSVGVMRELLAGMASLIEVLALDEIRSHVYKTNHASIRLHKALGFAVQQENDKAYEFLVPVAYLLNTDRALRLLRRAPHD